MGDEPRRRQMSDELRRSVVAHLLPSARSPEERAGIDVVANLLMSANKGYLMIVRDALGSGTCEVSDALKSEVEAVNLVRYNQRLRKWRPPAEVGWPTLLTLCMLREIVSNFRTVVACQRLIRALRVDRDAPPDPNLNEVIDRHFLDSVYAHHAAIRGRRVALYNESTDASR